MKLTKEMRSAIITKAMAGFMDIDKAMIEARRLAFGTKAYEHTYGKDEPLVMQLSESWRDMSDVITIACDGFSQTHHNQRIDRDNLDPLIQLERNRPFPPGYSNVDVVIKGARTVKDQHFPKHPLYDEAQKLVKDHRKILEKEDELRGKMSALLRSCNTVKQLEAAWPEAMDFLPKQYETSTALVPVGLSDQINKMLGIPSKASTATHAVRKAALKD